MFIYQGPIAVANLPRKQEGFLLFVKNIRDKVKANPAFAGYSGLAAFDTDVSDLDDACTKAKDKTPTTLADRDAKALKVYRGVGHVVDFAQGVADKQATAADAITFITSVGLQVKKTSSRKKPELAVKYSGLSGQVLIVALAIAGAGAYYWEYSVDQKAWTAVPETKWGQTTVAGLTPGQVYYFRFRALTQKGKSDYSQVVSILMH